MKIRTAYKTNGSGTGQIVAKGGGKQRTVTYDHRMTAAENHGAAAGVLANVFGFGPTRTVVTLSIDNGTAVFEV